MIRIRRRIHPFPLKLKTLQMKGTSPRKKNYHKTEIKMWIVKVTRREKITLKTLWRQTKMKKRLRVKKAGHGKGRWPSCQAMRTKGDRTRGKERNKRTLRR